MKRLSLKIIGGLIAILVLTHSVVSLAASTTSELNQEKQQNQQQINETEKEKEEITEQKNQTISEVETITTQISDYEAQIEELDTKIAELNTKISETEQQLNKAQEDYTKQEQLLEARLVATYEAGETSYLDFILSSDSITDLISNYYLVTEVATSDAELLEQIQKQKEDIEKAKTNLENSKNELATSKASKQSVSVQLQSAKEEKSQKVSQLSEEEKKLQERIDELAESNKSIDAKIRELQKTFEELNKQYSGTSNSGFIYPVPSAYARITTGMYYSSGNYHGAVDFGSGGINGQPVYAVADGRVMMSERLNGSYGNYILIAHNNGLCTLYAHGQDGSRTVSAGQTVKQGQQIMRVGNTGNSSGPHLHFEVRKTPGEYKDRVNPYNYLP